MCVFYDKFLLKCIPKKSKVGTHSIATLSKSYWGALFVVDCYEIS